MADHEQKHKRIVAAETVPWKTSALLSYLAATARVLVSALIVRPTSFLRLWTVVSKPVGRPPLLPQPRGLAG